MPEEPDVIADWVRERVLGSGGFGIVTLWRNINNHDRIAVKKYREESTVNLTPKHRERWTQEVQMMQRIQNENIVNFRELPPDFAAALNKYNPSKLPMLSMEYCSKGDLRSVLVRSENSCGLPESDVRTILSDLKNAVSYLHTLKITHRDLKPENIVLQFCDRPNNIIYKLIDLGYAKELDAKSISASFVGTLQYLAPELLYSKTYSCSVDYWSMGQVAFEVICGTRPFLPNMSPAQWMFHAHKKSAETICIHQQTEKPDSIKYSNEIFTECHVSSCFKREIEQWLQLALEYNPRKRGYKNFSADKPENDLAIFTSLKTILDKKIVTVFLVYNCEFCSYEIDDFTQITTVQKWIERDTKLALVEQVLLSPMCDKIDPNGLAVQVFDKTYRETMLYIFKKVPLISEDIKVKMVPQLVKDMLDGTSKDLMYYFQKRSYAHALYFIYKETKLYNSILDACSLKIKYTLQLCDETTQNCKLMNLSLEKLVAQKEFSNSLLNFDCKQYSKNYSQTATHWLDSFNLIVEKIQKLAGLCAQITVRFDSATRRAYLLNNAFCKDFSKHNNHDLNELLDTAILCYDGIRKKGKDNRTKPESCKSMLKILYDVLKSRDKLLRDRQFKDILQRILDMDHELDKILPTITGAKDHIEKFYKDLLADNIGRQSKIWDFTIKPKTNPPKSPELTKTNFILGNQNSLKDDLGTPISLSKPLNFILGDPQLSISIESSNSFQSPCGSPIFNKTMSTSTRSTPQIAQNSGTTKKLSQNNRTHIVGENTGNCKEITQNYGANIAQNSGVNIAQNSRKSVAENAQNRIVIAQNSRVIIADQIAQNNRAAVQDIAQIIGLETIIQNNPAITQSARANVATEEITRNCKANVAKQIAQNNSILVQEIAQNSGANMAEAITQNSTGICEVITQSNGSTTTLIAQNNEANISEAQNSTSNEVITQKNGGNTTEIAQTREENIPEAITQNSTSINEVITQENGGNTADIAQTCGENFADAIVQNLTAICERITPTGIAQNSGSIVPNVEHIEPKTENAINVPNKSDESDTCGIRLPNFQIGAPTSDIIQYNTSLRYELLEKTNESFIKCKSILSETLDFGFLND